MSLKELGITTKKIDDMLVAGIRFRMQNPQEMGSKFEELSRKCRDYICSTAMAVYDYGLGTERGVVTEACFPVTEAVQTAEIESRVLKGGKALTVIHHGPHEKIWESYQKLLDYMGEHGIPGSAIRREVFLECDPEDPGKDVTEIQVFPHDWEDRLARNVERVLGVDARREVMRGVEGITPESSKADRTSWIKAAIDRLDELADEDQKYDIVSSCAHVFSQKRIEELRAVWDRNHDIDELLKFMREDPDSWYAEPRREGSIIYTKKNPFDRKAWEESTTEAERKKAFCHCPMVRKNIDMIPPTFCYCGAGWYRQYWEGILGKPVKIEFLKSLTRGDDTCELAIHPPPEVIEKS